MADKNRHITIPKNVSSGDDLDFQFLKEKGLKYIEQLSSNFWTDYNNHDPGITILEMLCYAITDLGARISLPIENILTPADGKQTINEQFFGPEIILPSKPVSERDYRKLFIDLEGVKNCWLRPFEKTIYVSKKNLEGKETTELSYQPFNPGGSEDDQFALKGLYALTVDLEEGYSLADVEENIRNVYNNNRNLCEDLVEITEVGKHSIAVCAKIELEPDADEENIQAEIELALEKYFSPDIRFYSLREMFAKGYTSDEIFEGPRLKNGFIDPAELDKATLRKEIRLSDIIAGIMKIKGIKVITEISISDCSSDSNTTDEWLICVKKDAKPVICSKSAFSFYKGVLPLRINKSKVLEHKQNLIADEDKLRQNVLSDLVPETPSGTYQGTGETTTVQNDFPQTYGIGPVGLPPNAKEKRKAQAKQLKGYLLFFDQIFAAYFAHLEKVKEQLSVSNSFIDDNKEPSKTYFAQAVKDLNGIEELLEDYPLNNDQLLAEKLFPGYDGKDDLDNKILRNNRLLDHLIARFAERFSEYSFLMKELYGGYSDRAIIETKESFLKEYPEISSRRGQAFNHASANEIWNTGNVSGFQKRIAKLAGIKSYNRRNLSDSFVEIYIEPGSKPEVVYRWRIRNDENEIILSATDDYTSPRLAEEEMQFALVKILETAVSEIEWAFESPVKKDDTIGNFLIRVSEEGKYSFDIVNRSMPDWDVDYIVARQFSYYTTQAELKQAMIDIVKFIANKFSEEGMFAVEHILLRPEFSLPEEKAQAQFMSVCLDEEEKCQPLDPYSYRMTILLPGWTYRFSSIEFRRYLEQLIRAELPAHILARICWVGYRDDYYTLLFETNRRKIEDRREKLTDTYQVRLAEITSDMGREKLEAEYQQLMVELDKLEADNAKKFENELADLSIFETAYQKFLTNLASNPLANFEIDPEDVESEVPEENQETPGQKLIKAINRLNTIYQQGKLFDCDDDTDKLKGRIILDQTNLGTL